MTDKAYQTDRHIELRIYLMRHGLSQRGIARKLGITPQQLNMTLLNKRPGHKIRRRLVEEIGLPAELVGYTRERTAA